MKHLCYYWNFTNLLNLKKQNNMDFTLEQKVRAVFNSVNLVKIEK